MKQLPDPNEPQGWRHKRFKWYSLYSWGSPLLVTMVTVTMHTLPGYMTSNVVTPRMGEVRCFLGDKWAMIFYLNIIIIPLGEYLNTIVSIRS